MESDSQIPIPEQLYNSVVNGDFKTFCKLLEENPDEEFYADGRSQWLGDAATAGKLEIVQYLVSRGISVNEPENNDSVLIPEGVIVSAAWEGHVEVVQWMLDQGATVNFIIDGQERCSALSRSAMNGHLDVVKLLVERGAAVNACWAMHTPLDFAISYKKNDVADYLRSVGAKTAMELQG